MDEHEPTPPPVRRRADGPPRCRDCYYVLEGLRDRACPECGRPYDLADPATFTTRPPLVRSRLWLPGLLLAATMGFAAHAVFLMLGANIGFGLTVGVPMAIGVIVGYRCRVGPFIIAMLCIGGVVLAGAPLVMMHISGIICGGIAIVVGIMPAVLGGMLGWLLRHLLKQHGFSQSAWLPMLAMLLAAGISAVEAAAPRRSRVVTVHTTRVIDADPRVTWDNLLFFDQLAHVPLLCRVGLPRPLSTSGALDRPGDRQTCRFDGGWVAKELATVDPPNALEFTVIEQQIGFERSVRLRRGRFELEPAPGGRTRLTLATEYEALLRPRFAWRPGESLCVHVLHDAILDAIARGAERMQLSRSRAP